MEFIAFVYDASENDDDPVRTLYRCIFDAVDELTAHKRIKGRIKNIYDIARSENNYVNAESADDLEFTVVPLNNWLDQLKGNWPKTDLKCRAEKLMMVECTNVESATELAEVVADELSINDVLDDETHWIWDMAMRMYEGGK